MHEQNEYVKAVAALGARNLPPGGEDGLNAIIAEIERRSNVAEIIDLGCNTGWVSARLATKFPDATLIGVDLSPDMIRAAAARATRQGIPNTSYIVLNADSLHTVSSSADVIVSAGSSVFFRDVRRAFKSVRQALSDKGLFLDLHYLYDGNVPERLRQKERKTFGIKYTPSTAADWLRRYYMSGMRLDSFRLLRRYTLRESPAAALARQILRREPAIQKWAQELISKRKIIKRLEKYRRPAIFAVEPRRVLRREPQSHSLQTTMDVLSAFSAPVPRLPIEVIESLEPWYFLAYIGDPDCAPGGGRSVRRVAQILKTLGLNRDSFVLDVGSFTGLSTMVLTEEFPRTLGIDIEPAFVSIASTLAGHLRSGAKFKVMDACQPSLLLHSVDAVVLTATTGYCERPKQMLRGLKKLLKPAGYLVEFLYDYPSQARRKSGELHRYVSKHIQVRQLPKEIAVFEEQGYELVFADRLQSAQPAHEHAEQLIQKIVAAEKMRNSALSGSDIARFAELARVFVHRPDMRGLEPDVYLCAFQPVVKRVPRGRRK